MTRHGLVLWYGREGLTNGDGRLFSASSRGEGVLSDGGLNDAREWGREKEKHNLVNKDLVDFTG